MQSVKSTQLFIFARYVEGGEVWFEKEKPYLSRACFRLAKGASLLFIRKLQWSRYAAHLDCSGQGYGRIVHVFRTMFHCTLKVPGSVMTYLLFLVFDLGFRGVGTGGFVGRDEMGSKKRMFLPT